MMRKERKFCSRNVSKVTFKKNCPTVDFIMAVENFFFLNFTFDPSDHMFMLPSISQLKTEWEGHKTHKLVENDMVFPKKKNSQCKIEMKAECKCKLIILFCSQGYCGFNTDFVLLVLTIKMQ